MEIPYRIYYKYTTQKFNENLMHKVAGPELIGIGLMKIFVCDISLVTFFI